MKSKKMKVGLPVHLHLFLLFSVYAAYASKTTRMVLNVKAPIKQYTKTKESPFPAKTDDRRHDRAVDYYGGIQHNLYPYETSFIMLLTL